MLIYGNLPREQGSLFIFAKIALWQMKLEIVADELREGDRDEWSKVLFLRTLQLAKIF